MYELRNRTWVWSVKTEDPTVATPSTDGTAPWEHLSEARTAPRRSAHGVRLDYRRTEPVRLLVVAISRLMRSLPPEFLRVCIASDAATSSSGFVRVAVISASLHKIGLGPRGQ